MNGSAVDHVLFNIRVIRENRNYTLAYVSKKMGLNEAVYDLIEQGVIKITLEQLYKLIYVLDTDADSIFQRNTMRVVKCSCWLDMKDAV